MASSNSYSLPSRKSSSQALPNIDTSLRRQSSDSSTSTSTSRRTSSSISPAGSSTSLNTPTFNSTSPHPRVQLIPHSRTLSYDAAFSDSDRALLDQASLNFDAKDVSSRDFDFEDIFTYDKPQKKLNRCVEVSSHVHPQDHQTESGKLKPAIKVSERDWGNFSFSHYSSAVALRQKVNQHRSAQGSSKAAEMYVRNQVDARRR